MNNSERLALVNGRIVLPDKIVEGQALLLENKKIVGITTIDNIGLETQTLNVGNRLISPGLIDIHTHGALGFDFTDASIDVYNTIAHHQAKQGVTTLLATLTTTPLEILQEALEFCREWMRQDHNGSIIAGVHLEGPYFSLDQKGAQDPNNMRTPDDGSADIFLLYSDCIKIFSYAPELPGAIEFTKRLVEKGIVAAAGHSSALDRHILQAMEAGLSHTIHIWSGQSSTVREGPWRKPGLLEATLTFDDLTAEMISDNRHLPPTLMKLAYKCKGPDKLCVISDSTNGAGLPEGTVVHASGMDFEVSNGVGILLDHTSFAGSTTLINQMIPILTNEVGIPLVEVIRMASLTPAKVIHIDDKKGSISPGKDADIAIFNDDFTAWKVFIGGSLLN
ncbi:MAG TPA: N-acetylglucosamine-6-phosphate deacetylase [Candidatus Atribacteria bacterium]|nr:N-acetylglucosamine-6-phosphate deacetylase [Candidatus Atribacteria bacterium]